MEIINTVHDFDVLRHMWFGGAGRFVFANTKTLRNFCVKFVPIKRFYRRTGESEVWCAFLPVTNSRRVEPTYVKIGKYNPTTDDYHIASTAYANKEVLDLLLMSFHFVKKHIYNDIPFGTPDMVTLVAENCCRCGRPLLDPKHIKDGYGEECQRYVSKQLPVQLQLKMA